MRTSQIVIASAVLLFARLESNVATAQTSDPSIIKAEDLPKDLGKPLDWEVGDKAVVVKGAGLLATALAAKSGPEKWKPFAEYDVNAQYSYDGTDRIGDVTWGPAVSRSWLKANVDANCADQPFKKVPAAMWTWHGHARGRHADLDESKDVTEYKTALLVGIGTRVRVYPDFINEWSALTGTDVEMPTLGVTWYKPLTDENPDTALTTRQVQARFESEIPIPVGWPAQIRAYTKAHREFIHKINCTAADQLTEADFEEPERPAMLPVRLSIDVKFSEATEGGDDSQDGVFIDVALKWLKPDSKIGLAVRYRTGNDLGFEYDSAFLAGALMRFGSP